MTNPTSNDLTTHAPLLSRLRGEAFLPGVGYATQAEAWMKEAANELERLRKIENAARRFVAMWEPGPGAPWEFRDLFALLTGDRPAPETSEPCMHGRIVCEPCAQLAVRQHEKTIALAKEIHDRHDRINKLLYGPGSVRNAILGPMDSDAAHRDRGALLSMLTPAQRGSIEETSEQRQAKTDAAALADAQRMYRELHPEEPPNG